MGLSLSPSYSQAHIIGMFPVLGDLGSTAQDADHLLLTQQVFPTRLPSASSPFASVLGHRNILENGGEKTQQALPGHGVQGSVAPVKTTFQSLSESETSRSTLLGPQSGSEPWGIPRFVPVPAFPRPGGGGGGWWLGRGGFGLWAALLTCAFSFWVHISVTWELGKHWSLALAGLEMAALGQVGAMWDRHTGTGWDLHPRRQHAWANVPGLDQERPGGPTGAQVGSGLFQPFCFRDPEPRIEENLSFVW